MGSDIWLVLQWWGTLFLVGAVAFPLTKALFGEKRRGNFTDDRQQNNTVRGWWDGGYLFGKAVGMAVVTWIVFVLGTLRLMPFSVVSIWVAMGILFVGGALFHKGNKGDRGNKGWKRAILVMALEEIFFFAALLFWSWVKGHEPSIRGLEKFMDYGFMKSIVESRFFPPADMWYAGLPINYYYFGHMVVAVLTKLSGIDLAYTFNLMLASLFALTFTMSFSIGKQLIGEIRGIRDIGKIGGGLLTAFLVTLAGNMQTLYAFTRGYTGDNVKPFWELAWKIGEMWGIRGIGEKLAQGMQTYWYANATRFIPFTIHEFPSYSFVVSDVHGHVLSLPFVLLAIALLVTFFSSVRDPLTKTVGRTNPSASLRASTTFWQGSLTPFSLGFYGLLVGVLLMTNALDGPIYLMLFVVVLAAGRWSGWGDWGNWGEKGKAVGVVVLAAGVTSLPFLSHFKSFVSGVAVNCPPGFLANTKIGPILFEGVEKCQHSPIWMLWILWGFLIYCGAALIIRKIWRIREIRDIGEIWETKYTHIDRMLVVFFLFSLVLIIFPEFFYFKDIYPAHFRSNTMFKLGYQAFILFSIVSGYSIVSFLGTRNNGSQKLFLLFLLPQLILVSIYPIFSVRSYFNGLKTYQGLYGLAWMQKEYPDDYRAILWLNSQVTGNKQGSPTTPKARGAILTGLPVIIEADGDSYTDYARMSAFTGMPTIIGWPVHEWLWRGGYDVVAPRREVVQKIYESDDLVETREFLGRFHVRYVVVGKLERQKYPNLAKYKFSLLGKEAFRSGETVVYAMDDTSY